MTSLRSSPEQRKQQPPRGFSFFDKIRETASSIPLFNRRPRKNSPDNIARAADATYPNDPAMSHRGFLQSLIRSLRFSSKELNPEISRHPQSPVVSRNPRQSDSSTLSDSAQSSDSGAQASTSSSRSTESTILTSSRNSERFHILVKGHENIRPEEALGMNACFDTGCAGDLMGRHHFDRLKREHNIRMYPSKADIVSLCGKRIKVHGIARRVIWQLGKGYKTYKSDFYILDMDQFDVLIGRDTIFDYNIYNLGTDIATHLRRTRENEERRLQELREIFQRPTSEDCIMTFELQA
ncbi:hypothetical protein BJX64DRAFT_220803 [Aspergillus heterothallicus]